MLSRVGVAVRAGAPKPDIGTADAFKAALVAAKSVAYSQGASGQHFVTVIARLGLVDTLKPKTIIVQGRPVGAAVASGRGRDRRAAGRRAASCSRHRPRRPAAPRPAEDHRLRRGHPGQGQGGGCRQGIGEVPLLGGGHVDDQAEGHGPGRAGAGGLAARRRIEFRHGRKAMRTWSKMPLPRRRAWAC